MNENRAVPKSIKSAAKSLSLLLTGLKSPRPVEDRVVNEKYAEMIC
jgi:hypothetical protein